MPNIKIKAFGPDPDAQQYPTEKFQLVDPDEMIKDPSDARKKPTKARHLGYRELEAGEVVEIDEDRLKTLMAIRGVSGVIEITMDPVTRPLFFASADQARQTSKAFPLNDNDRVQQQKEALEAVKTSLAVSADG